MQKHIKFFSAILLALTIILSIIITNETLSEKIPVSNIVSNRQKVIIDAGHGGFDGGAVASNGTEEKEINLDIALKVRDFLSVLGYDVIMTREEDIVLDKNGNGGGHSKTEDMRYRLSLMDNNSDAVFVSIHQNKYSSASPKGMQVFYSKNNEDSKLLAEALQKTVKEKLQSDNHRLVKPAGDNIFLLKNATVPAVIAECGFISNPEDLSNLSNEEYRRKIAFLIAMGINDFFQMAV